MLIKMAIITMARVINSFDDLYFYNASCFLSYKQDAAFEWTLKLEGTSALQLQNSWACFQRIVE